MEDIIPPETQTIIERIRVNDKFLGMVNALYADDPALFEGLREKALSLHAGINTLLRKRLNPDDKNK